jgi:hypothetical protein
MKILVLSCVAAMIVACGGKSGGTGNGTDGGSTTGDGGGTVGDGGGAVGDGGGSGVPDGGVVSGCVPGATQCSNCLDDDGDGRFDGFDPQCTGAADDDEATFATGIPGDNMDAISQDCFFDGNSGGGDDGCAIHVCCLLGVTTDADCTQDNKYDHNKCPPPIGTGAALSQQCINTCGKLAPPGCDCFGCCTICDPTTKVCTDIIINPTVSPDCSTDPTKCLTCTKNTLCGGGECSAEDGSCVLCPGQDPEDLPDTCMGNTCPNGEQTCGGAGDMLCPDTTFCSNGCCIGVIF